MKEEIQQKLTNALMDGINFTPLETDLLELESSLEMNGLELTATAEKSELNTLLVSLKGIWRLAMRVL